jgi:hypothetical protein
MVPLLLVILSSVAAVLLLVLLGMRSYDREGWRDEVPGPSTQRRYRIPFAHFGGVPNSSQLWGPMTHSTP